MNKNNKERFDEIKNIFKHSNKYMLTVGYDHIKFLIRYNEILQKDVENLKKVVNVEKVMCENMIGDVEIICMYKDQFLRDYGDDYISKSKIQETIKVLEKHIIMNSDKFAIQVLKDILKEN